MSTGHLDIEHTMLPCGVSVGLLCVLGGRGVGGG